jgi:hypothetical protein
MRLSNVKSTYTAKHINAISNYNLFNLRWQAILSQFVGYGEWSES